MAFPQKLVKQRFRVQPHRLGHSDELDVLAARAASETPGPEPFWENWGRLKEE
ncbi:hypothetical protein [Microvirga sp. 3-52]|jgi:hypothetical protein|uniref:hypothetical protein n=1 Tax=Microvirga sp. 3-52 TaxID=2792425 RepID=UPI0020BEEC36|nr:hypothetical protein [Microvirga sp. 3-52]